MVYKEIIIVDDGCEIYSQQIDNMCLGNQYDDEALTIRVVKPEEEDGSSCFMIVSSPNGKIIDNVSVGNDGVVVRKHISQFPYVNIGFSFIRSDGSTKNCSFERYTFVPGLDPDSSVEISTGQHLNINNLTAFAFTSVEWKSGSGNTLVFSNINNQSVFELPLSGFTQEQSDLAETDPTKETFVKGKKTSNLFNDGDGKSRFATEEFVQGQVPEVDFSQIEEQINDVRAVAEGKTKSFTVQSLAGLGAILGIDTSVVADEYEITTTEIVYKDKLYTLHQGDLFIIVDTQVPDYWVSIDDMKIYKMETSKVDLTGLATETYVQDQIASAITTTLNTGV